MILLSVPSENPKPLWKDLFHFEFFIQNEIDHFHKSSTDPRQKKFPSFNRPWQKTIGVSITALLFGSFATLFTEICCLWKSTGWKRIVQRLPKTELNFALRHFNNLRDTTRNIPYLSQVIWSLILLFIILD